MIAWRITKRRYSTVSGILGGEGARDGGRWNRPGLPLVYASENSSLAILETLAHVAERRLPKSLVVVRIRIPDGAGVRVLREQELPKRWREVGSRECIGIGSAWIESGAGLMLRVPSAVNRLEHNILLNPHHADIARCAVDDVVPVAFDVRTLALVR